MKTTKFMTSGTTIRVVEFDESTSLDKLPTQIYTVMYNQMMGFYLSIYKDRFNTPSRVYGTASKKAERVHNTYKLRDKSTGILLTGDKGSGKTMLSSLVCNKLLDDGVPVLLVNEPFSGTEFNQFIESIGECVMFYDEFAKTFEKQSDQDGLLTLMDGTSSNKRLFILTENNERRINEFILDRPSRVFYHFRYDKLEQDVIKEYCCDQGVGNIVDDIISVYNRTLEFSFDILTSIVEEYKRYPNQDFVELLDDINFTVFGSNESARQLFIEKVTDMEGNELKINMSKRVVNDPFDTNDSFRVGYFNSVGDEDSTFFSVEDIQDVNSEYMVFCDQNDDVIVKCRKLPPKTFNKSVLC